MDTKVAVVGVGHTAYGKRGEFGCRGTFALACEAISAACGDAGISPADVDGYAGYADEAIDPVSLASAFGAPRMRYAGMVWGGGGGGVLGSFVNAVSAIAGGHADYVVVHRSLSMGGESGRFGQQQVQNALTGELPQALAFSGPYGLLTPAQVFALNARRHMHRYGTTSEHFAEIAINARLMAANNPDARFRTPITVEDHHSSRMIADPLRLLDCCMETDGAAAVVLCSEARARDLRHRPVFVHAAAMGANYRHSARASIPDDDFASAGQRTTGDELFRKSGVSPKDIDVALIYDHFTSMVLMALEDFGFCGRGESGPFVAEGNVRLCGSLPLNPHGGHLAEAYLHGVNHIIEGVRQLRGTARNQIADAELAFVSAAGGVAPTTAAILSR